VERQRHVLERRQRGQQVEELEDEADLVAPDECALVVGQPAQAPAVDGDFTRARAVEAADEVEKLSTCRNRTAPRWTPSRRDRCEGDVLERRNLLLSVEALETPDSWIIRRFSVLCPRFSGSHAQSTEN
jgi:hypothetical protein